MQEMCELVFALGSAVASFLSSAETSLYVASVVRGVIYIYIYFPLREMVIMKPQGQKCKGSISLFIFLLHMLRFQNIFEHSD